MHGPGAAFAHFFAGFFADAAGAAGASAFSARSFASFFVALVLRILFSRESMGIKEFQEAMQGYHDLIDTGRREIYQLEQ